MTVILTFANRKGGAGKSTCAAHFAMEAVKEGKKVILIDLDSQRSLERWWELRKDENPYFAEAASAGLLEKINLIKEKEFDLCIIDTPGDTSANTRAGIEVADLVVIPSKATAVDLAAIGRSIQMVDELKKKYVFIVTQTIQRSSAALQAASALSEFGPVAPSSISNRVAYVNAMGMGTTAALLDKSAENELDQCWKFIKSKLFKGTEHHGKEKI